MTWVLAKFLQIDKNQEINFISYQQPFATYFNCITAKTVSFFPDNLASVPSNGVSQASVYAEADFSFIDAVEYSTLLHNILHI